MHKWIALLCGNGTFVAGHLTVAGIVIFVILNVSPKIAVVPSGMVHLTLFSLIDAIMYLTISNITGIIATWYLIF